MHHSLRSISALCCLGWLTMFGLHGCSGRLGPVQATQNGGSIDRPNLPDIFVEQAKECVEFDGRQLEKGRIVLESTVNVNKDGDKVGVTVNGIPETARDFGICIRKVLQDIPIAKQSLQDAVKMLEFYRKHAKDSDDALERFIEVIPGVPIVESELVLEADGYTVVLPVTVKVRAKLEELVDIDEPMLKKIGQMALDTLGYDGIMNRAEEQGWVKRVPIEQAQSIGDKRFIGDGVSPASVQEIVKESFKLVMTKSAPVAVTISQLDSPAPGYADLVAVGIFAVSLVAVGGVSVYVYVQNKDAPGPTPQPQPPPAPTPQVPPPPLPQPPPPPPPRRHPYQTCENDELDRLEAAKKAVCPEKPQTFPGRSCHHKTAKEKALAEKYPCSLLRSRIAAVNTCVAARQKVQDECFKGSPDTGHPQQIADLSRGNSLCEALKAINCAPSHPMSGL